MGIYSSSVLGRMKDKVAEMAKNAKKIGKDDPRRIAHSAKVGLALTVNSFFYYYHPLYDGFGQSGIWALLTVIFVFEFTVGATLSKGLNRSFATLLAGAMGVGANYLADLSGEKAEPVVLGLLVFILAAILTFTRFNPGIKKFDYGVVIFILTFSMVTVSGYRTEQIIHYAQQRLSTVAIGAVSCMLISVLIFPAWAGEDLQNLIAANIEKLGRSLEGFGNAYFWVPFGEESGSGSGSDSDVAFPQDYKSAFNSKTSEESLATSAGWEFGHGEFKFRHPWKEYLKVGGLARECASHLQALCGYLNADDDQKMQTLLSFKSKIQGPCTRMCSESTQALKAISSAIKTMAQPSPAIQGHLLNSRAAIDDLEVVFRSSSLSPEQLFEIIPCAAVTSILIDIVNCVDKISKSVYELSEKAGFKKPKAAKSSSPPPEAQQPPQQQLLHRGIVKPLNEDSPESEVVAITIIDEDTHKDSPEFDNFQAPRHEQKSQELITGEKTG